MALPQLCEALVAIEPGHRKVEEDGVGLDRLHQLHQLVAAACRPGDLDSRPFDGCSQCFDK